MRVIAGKCRSLPLKTIDGLDTRPTTDRTKETLFNVLQPWIPGGTFLDLFSGSGAIGIEALSRGARKAVFVELSRKAAACITDNLAFTRLEEDAVLMQESVQAALGKLEAFDCIFMDPPSEKGLEKEVLVYLSDSGLLQGGGVVVVEASLQTGMDYAEELGFVIVKEKRYKTNKHVFLQKI